MTPDSPSATPSRKDVRVVYRGPLLDLVYRAASVHREHNDPAQIQCSSLLNIKTGACPEDCSYCSQSAHNQTELGPEPLMETDEVIRAAERAKAGGADRFCMGAAWRGPRDGRDFNAVLEMITEVKALGLETCATLGMIDEGQATKLEEAGLDFYNHNLDTSPEYYPEIITTRTFDDRLETLAAVRKSGMKVCTGGILGMGESEEDRIGLIHSLASLDPHPESVPINALVPVPGTPLEDSESLPWDQMVRAVATTRIFMPEARVRLSAGRLSLSEEGQTLCFLSGANSIFLGDQLLTTPNVAPGSDTALFEKLGLDPLPVTSAIPV
ncbi:MAG TPA: biotin synthase BioB [Planctomycetes bacterium]|nr:biotin synthase BioB [Planctomycetota bacterium]